MGQSGLLWVEKFHSKGHVYLEPQNETLFVNKVFANVISEFKLRLLWIRVGPNPTALLS